MKPIFGEHDCKIDSKGRFLLPVGLRKQLPKGQQDDFVVNRGIEICLVLYPRNIWEEELAKIQSKNRFVAKNRAFARKFLNGATPVAVDGNSRILIPKRLLDYAKLDKEIILVAAFDRIEMWDKTTYDNWLKDERYDLEKLSEEVMGDEQADGLSLA